MGSPWLFGAFILVFERRAWRSTGPAPLLLSLLAPALVVFDNWQVVQGRPRTHNLFLLISSLLINVVLVWRFGLRSEPVSEVLHGMPELVDDPPAELRGIDGADKEHPLVRLVRRSLLADKRG